MTENYDLGSGHRYESVSKNGEPYGIIVYHTGTCKCVGDECGGSISYRGKGDGRPEWDVLNDDPLTLSPSLLCHCGDHGWIRDGKWEA